MANSTKSPLLSKIIFVATNIITGEQHLKEYTVREMVEFEGYYGLLRDITSSESRTDFVLRALPSQAKRPFYVYDTVSKKLSIHTSAAVFADENYIQRVAVSNVLTKKQNKASGWLMWYVGETPPSYSIKCVENDYAKYDADTWEELARCIDISKQALSNGCREGRKVMGWDVYKETINLPIIVANFEVSEEFSKSVDIIQNPWYNN